VGTNVSGDTAPPAGAQHAHSATTVPGGAAGSITDRLTPDLGYSAPSLLRAGGVENKAPGVSVSHFGHAPSHYVLSESFLEALALDSSRSGAVPGGTETTPGLQVETSGPGSQNQPFAFDQAPDSESLRDVMMRFQSLGDNCEFGLLQRRAGAEPLDFLRFAGFYVAAEELLQQTIGALTTGFAGIGDPESIVCELHGEPPRREYMVRDVHWSLMYHSGYHEGEIDPDTLRSQQALALGFRCREILADMKAAERVFVWKSNVQSSELDVRELVSCLRGYGPNLLLWVNLEDADHPAGLVEYAGGSLLKGYVRSFAPYAAAEEIEFESWYAMCRNAAAAADRLRQLNEWSHPMDQ
jgi:hypothetical protein